MIEYNADDKMVLATNIKSIIKEKGISQKELADKVNTTETSISRYISGSRMPKATTLRAIAKVLGVTMDSLMERRTDESD